MPILCENLLQAILDPALVVQEDGVILAGNAAAWRFLGMVDGKQLIGYSLINCLPGPPDGGESLSGQVLHSLQQTLATGNQRAEWVRRRPDISPVTIEVSFSVMEGTSPRQVLVQWRDISERRQMEDALRRSEERYRLLAENAHDVIWVLGLDSRFIYVSPSVQKLRGYTPEEVLQQSMEEVLTPESLRLVQESMAFIVQDVQSGVRVDHELTEVEQPCKDGSTVWTEVKTTGLYDDAGRFIGLLGVTRDIRERRQRDEQLRQLNATLEQRVQERTAELEAANTRLAKALQHKDEFLATMSHELRTPLTGVLSFAQTLEEEIYGSLLPRQLQAVQLIRGAEWRRLMCCAASACACSTR
jgi:PAS domain S-box-containing protein